MKNIENKAMLITYADSMGTDLKALDRVLDKHFAGVFGGVHVLPFFPSSGDRGFAVVNYDIVDPAFGGDPARYDHHGHRPAGGEILPDGRLHAQPCVHPQRGV